jgi:hypothetical protein
MGGLEMRFGPKNLAQPSGRCSTSSAVVLEFIGKSCSNELTPGGRILLKFNDSVLELVDFDIEGGACSRP